MELIRVIQKIYEKTTKVRREAIKRDEEEPTLIYIYIYIAKKERKKERKREGECHRSRVYLRDNNLGKRLRAH